MKSSDETHYMNVDLDVYSRFNLQPLIDGLTPGAHTLHEGVLKVKRTYQAHFEIDKYFTDADKTIRQFCDLLEHLPKPARDSWKSAKIRDFNIGIQAERQPRAAEFAVSPETLARVAKLGARVVITVYAPWEGQPA